MSQNNGVLAASIPYPARDNTTYVIGNYGNVYSNVYLPGGLTRLAIHHLTSACVTYE
jgi:hypothetical protein